MNKGLLLILCVALMAGMLASCSRITSPDQVVGNIDPNATVSQFGYSTWQTELHADSVQEVRKSFVDAGYKPVQATAIEGMHNAPDVLAAGNNLVTLYKTDDGVRVMWDTYDSAAHALLTPNAQTGTGEVTMVQVGVIRNATTDNPAIGMCYVYRLSDGRAVILDGGIFGNESVIYKTLETLGIVKDSRGRYQIAAWILSHGHGDHFGALYSFAEAYKDSTTVEYLMYSLPMDPSVLASLDVPYFVNYLSGRYPDAIHVTPHAGLRYYIGNLTLDMLYTPDMLKGIDYENDTSLIFIADCGGARVLHMGDAGDKAAAVACKTYESTAFAASAFQMTHHGLTTGANDTHDWENLRSIYDATQAKTVLLPMGTRSPTDSRNGRHTVLVAWGYMGYQTSYLIDTQKSNTNRISTAQASYDKFVEQIFAGTSKYETFCGYDGKNIIYNKQKDLTTYIASTETEEMVTVCTLSADGMHITANLLLSEWLK